MHTYTFDVCRFSVEVSRNDEATSRATKSERRVSSEGEGSQEKGKEGEKEMPMYTFTPVDRYGDNKEQTEPLQDLGTCTCTCMTTVFLIKIWHL